MMRTSASAENFLIFLEKEKVLKPEAVQRAQAVFVATKHPIDVVLRELAFLPEVQIAELMSKFCGQNVCETINNVDEELLERIGAGFAQNHALIPSLQDKKHRLIVADPFALLSIEAISYFLDSPVLVAVAPRSLIEHFFQDRVKALSAIELSELSVGAEDDDVDRLLDIAREAPVVKFVSQMLQYAVDERATDIHIEPFEDSIRIRLRRDGILEDREKAPRSIAAGVTSRIKILARLNISERRLPQDGRLRMAIRGYDVDFRVSVMPSIHGETIVLRVLDRLNVRLDLNALGYDQSSILMIKEMISRPNGMLLLTGPTGSGKTTTLYSILNQLNDSKSKIFTVEDPVEYRFTGVTQLQVDSTIGLTFASALRSVLRQDPDIILIGEIRDAETARIAVQAALTGHLVLSTLHANSSAGAVNRLRDMGIENYLLASTLRGVIGQRLLRKQCSRCLGGVQRTSCKACGGSGYVGRCAAYEIMAVTDGLQEAIGRNCSQQEIEMIATNGGMRTLARHARDLINSGITTEKEVIRVVDLQGE